MLQLLRLRQLLPLKVVGYRFAAQPHYSLLARRLHSLQTEHQGKFRLAERLNLHPALRPPQCQLQSLRHQHRRLALRRRSRSAIAIMTTTWSVCLQTLVRALHYPAPLVLLLRRQSRGILSLLRRRLRCKVQFCLEQGRDGLLRQLLLMRRCQL